MICRERLLEIPRKVWDIGPVEQFRRVRRFTALKSTILEHLYDQDGIRAVIEVGEIGDPRAGTLLRSILEVENPDLRFIQRYAAIALGKVSAEPSTEELLGKCLHSEWGEIRTGAAEGLSFYRITRLADEFRKHKRESERVEGFIKDLLDAYLDNKLVPWVHAYSDKIRELEPNLGSGWWFGAREQGRITTQDIQKFLKRKIGVTVSESWIRGSFDATPFRVYRNEILPRLDIINVGYHGGGITSCRPWGRRVAKDIVVAIHYAFDGPPYRDLPESERGVIELDIGVLKRTEGLELAVENDYEMPELAYVCNIRFPSQARKRILCIAGKESWDIKGFIKEFIRVQVKERQLKASLVQAMEKLKNSNKQVTAVDSLNEMKDILRRLSTDVQLAEDYLKYLYGGVNERGQSIEELIAESEELVSKGKVNEAFSLLENSGTFRFLFEERKAIEGTFEEEK